jgi:hypothetical protein
MLGFKSGRRFKMDFEISKLKHLKEKFTSHKIWGHGDQ